MAEFYILDGVIGPDELYIEDYEAAEVLDMDYSKGKSIPKQKPVKLFYKSASKRKPDYLSGIYSFPVISRRFRDLLEEKKVSHVEYHPAHLIPKRTGEVDDSYSVLNLLDNVPCFDWERSEWKPYPETEDVVYQVFKLAIRTDKLAGRDLARVAEIPSLILVRDTLRQAMEAAGLTGLAFEEIADFKMVWE